MTVTITIPVDNVDTFIDGDSPDANHVSGNNLFIGNYVNARRSLLRFDFSQLRAGLTITNAVLGLYVLPTPLTGYTIDVYELTQHNWIPELVTWNKYDGVNSWTNLGGDWTTNNGVQIVQQNTPNAYDTFDVTGMVKNAYANNGGVLDCIVKLDTETYNSYIYGYFGGRNYGNYFGLGLGTSPYLSITFDYPNPASSLNGTDTGDTMIAQGQSTNNWGAGTQLYVHGSSGSLNRALFRFDNSALPAGMTILSARMYLWSLVGTTPEKLWAYRMTQIDWVEGTGGGSGADAGATWDTYDAGNSLSWETPGGDYTTEDGGYTYGLNATGWMVFDVTAMALYAQAHNKNILNVLVRDDNEINGGNWDFCSKEYGTYIPYLVIIYGASGMVATGSDTLWFGMA